MQLDIGAPSLWITINDKGSGISTYIDYTHLYAIIYNKNPSIQVIFFICTQHVVSVTSKSTLMNNSVINQSIKRLGHHCVEK